MNWALFFNKNPIMWFSWHYEGSGRFGWSCNLQNKKDKAQCSPMLIKPSKKYRILLGFLAVSYLLLQCYQNTGVMPFDIFAEEKTMRNLIQSSLSMSSCIWRMTGCVCVTLFYNYYLPVFFPHKSNIPISVPVPTACNSIMDGEDIDFK